MNTTFNEEEIKDYPEQTTFNTDDMTITHEGDE